MKLVVTFDLCVESLQSRADHCFIEVVLLRFKVLAFVPIVCLLQHGYTKVFVMHNFNLEPKHIEGKVNTFVVLCVILFMNVSIPVSFFGMTAQRHYQISQEFDCFLSVPLSSKP